MERLKADLKVEWNDRYEFVCDGVAVTGNNMIDLLNGKKKEACVDGVATVRASPQASQRIERSGRPPRSVAVHAASGAVTTTHRTNEPQPSPPIITTVGTTIKCLKEYGLTTLEEVKRRSD